MVLYLTLREAGSFPLSVRGQTDGAIQTACPQLAVTSVCVEKSVVQLRCHRVPDPQHIGGRAAPLWSLQRHLACRQEAFMCLVRFYGGARRICV